MKRTKLNQFIMPVAATLVLSSASVLAHDHSESNESSEMKQGWQETKRDAKEYWTDFKQDAKQTWGDSKEAFRDGWVEGKLQSVLLMSEHIDVNDIDIEVNDYVATLSGAVDNEVTRELAEELAKGVEGINEVDNKLKIKKDKKDMAKNESDRRMSVGRYVADSLLTAELKLDLIQSESVPAMDLNLTVNDDVVIIEGEVKSESVKDLAEKIVSNNVDVREVVNNIEVKS